MNTLALQIVPGSEPIEGALRAPDGTEREFTGTLGLLAAVEALRDYDGSPPDDAGKPGEESA